MRDGNSRQKRKTFTGGYERNAGGSSEMRDGIQHRSISAGKARSRYGGRSYDDRIPSLWWAMMMPKNGKITVFQPVFSVQTLSSAEVHPLKKPSRV